MKVVCTRRKHSDPSLNAPENQGVYSIRYEGEIVYVGMTWGKEGLRGRLSEHAGRKERLHKEASTPVRRLGRAVIDNCCAAYIKRDSRPLRHATECAAIYLWNPPGNDRNMTPEKFRAQKQGTT